MVGVFGRSVSFTNKNPSAPRPTRHVRSASLPCSRSSHPLTSALTDDINGIKTWAEFGSSTTRTSAWLLSGLTRLRTLHDALDDFLHLSHPRASLRARPDLVDTPLADVLKYVDAYATFQQSLMAMKEAQRAACLGMMRKRDDQMKLHEYKTAMKKMNSEMSKLVSSIKSLNPDALLLTRPDDETAAAIKDVGDATAAVSIALFNGLCSQPAGKRKRVTLLPPWMRIAEKIDLGIEELKEVSTLERMEELGEVIDCIETCSERVFRGLINTRVSLLNVLTQ